MANNPLTSRLRKSRPQGKARGTSQYREAMNRWQGSSTRRWMALFVAVFAMFGMLRSVDAQGPAPPEVPTAESANLPATLELPDQWIGDPREWTKPERLSSTLQVMLLLTVISLAPAVLVMSTCFVRIIVVLGILRQALGTQQLPPSQVITSIAMFMTLLVMSPVWMQVYDNAIKPYTNQEIGLEEAWQRGIKPMHRFMSLQIERTGNSEDVWLFLEYMPNAPEPKTYEEVPLEALLPAFMLSELKTAFLIGFQIYLPFVILDIVIASVMIAMGMLMLPPVLISLPFKLLLFVLVDGWHLVVGMLLESFQPLT